MFTGSPASRRGVVASLVIVFIAAACSSGGGTVTPGTSPSPSTVPSPSSSPADVSAALIKVLGDDGFSGRAEMTGSSIVAGLEGEASGTFEFGEKQSRMEITLTFAGQATTTENIHIGDRSWKRTDDEPWVLDARPSDDDETTLAEVLKATRSLRDEGVEQRGGRQVHRLALPSSGELEEALGLDPTLEDADFELEFLAESDGTPVAMIVTGTWQQVIGEERIDCAMTLDFAFKDIGTAIDVEPPADAWTLHRSNAFDYTMAYPEGWEVAFAEGQDVFSLDGQPFIFVTSGELLAGTTLAEYRDAVIDVIQTDVGVRPDEVRDAKLDGQAAIRLVYHATIGEADMLVVDYATIRGDGAWEVSLMTLAGSGEAADVAYFEQFLSTFDFTD